jgi:hypothetical protein
MKKNIALIIVGLTACNSNEDKADGYALKLLKLLFQQKPMEN